MRRVALFFLILGLIGFMCFSWSHNTRESHEIQNKRISPSPNLEEAHVSQSFTPKNESVSSDPLLEEEKQEFYQEHNYKVNPYQTIGLRSPIIEFWIDRLQHPDPTKRREALEKFFLALDNFSIHENPRILDPDVAMLRQMMFVFQMSAEQGVMQVPETGIRKYESFSYLRNQPSLLRLIERVTPYLSERETEAKANKILNFYTLECYSGKDRNWWETEFQNSKLAGLFAGLPPWEWPKRKE